MAALAAGHHQLLAHGYAVQALRATTTARLGPVNSYAPARPGSDEPRDRLASLAVDAVRNQFFTKPLFGGGYPMLVIDLLRRVCPEAISVIKPEDESVIA